MSESFVEQAIHIGVLGWALIGLTVLTVILLVTMRFKGALLAGMMWMIFWLIMIWLALLALGTAFTEDLIVITFPDMRFRVGV